MAIVRVHGAALILIVLADWSFSKPASAQLLHIQGDLGGSFFFRHAEYDPNPGVPFADRPTARYGLDANFQLNAVAFPRVFFFSDLHFYFGDSRPQHDYNYSTKPLAANLMYGVGLQISHSPDLQLRWAEGKWKNLGGLVYGDRLPWSALQVRWTFDNQL